MAKAEGEGAERVAEYLRSLGPDARRARRLLGVLLNAGPTSLDEVVARSGAPRRDVEHVVRLMGDDANRNGHEIEVVAPEPFAALALPATAPHREPLPLAAMEEALRAAPAAVKSLDHV